MTSPPRITFCKQSKMFPNALYRLNVLHITSQQTRGSNEYICRKWVWIMDGRTKSLNNVLILPALLWMRKEIFRYMSRSGTEISVCAKSEAQDIDSTTFQLEVILLIYVLNCTGAHWGSCRDCRIRSLSLRAQISECLPHNSGGTIAVLENRAVELHRVQQKQKAMGTAHDGAALSQPSVYREEQFGVKAQWLMLLNNLVEALAILGELQQFAV